MAPRAGCEERVSGDLRAVFTCTALGREWTMTVPLSSGTLLAVVASFAEGMTGLARQVGADLNRETQAKRRGRA